MAKLAEAGALATAGTVAATIFCCLPFTSGAAGALLAAFGAHFAPFRPYLTALSVGCLGYALYGAYRPAPCVDGACAPAARPRRLLVWVVAAFVALMLTASWWADWIIYWTL